MQSRRKFLGNFTTGIAGSLAASNVLGANDRIRFGVIGAGNRGVELLRGALSCPNTELAAAADVYTKRLEAVGRIKPDVRTHLDYRRLLEDRSIDAVLIATPHHLHAEHFVAALEAGKHVYLEKTMAFSVAQAKRMRTANQRAGRRAVQIGHQGCSSGQVADAATFLSAGGIGRITAISSYMYRNTPHGKPQWARPVYPDMTPENIEWQAFLGEAPEREFDPHRFINWRLFWDYSGGNVYENMCHQLAFWYKVLGLRIPRRVAMTGGIYLWKDGREVPDTMSVSMEHPEEMLFTWESGFGNAHKGMAEEALGTDGTIARGQQIRYFPERVNRPDGEDVMGTTTTAPNAHMRNFLDAIRSGAETACPFETGFRVSIACRMAVESYRQGRPVEWDAAKEEIV